MAKANLPQDLIRFLLRWQHVAPGTQLVGDAGLMAVIEQLQGFEAAAVAWLRLAPRPCNPPAAPGSPSKATPIAVVYRDDLPWLITARGDGTLIMSYGQGHRRDHRCPPPARLRSAAARRRRLHS